MQTKYHLLNRILNKIAANKKQFTFPFFLLISFILFTVIAQNKSNNNLYKGIPDGEDSLNTNQPQINYKVNKQYDDKGNLIGYDSTYSYSFSSPGSNINITFGNDSMLGMFNNMNMQMDMFNNDFFNNFFKTDSMQFPNNNMFFNDPFFNNNMDMMNQLRQQMNRMQNMDSLFYKQNTIPAPDDKDKKPENMITL